MTTPGTGAETVVVKCGGDGGVDLDRLCADIAALVAAGVRVVLVHGGSVEIARLAGQLGVGLHDLVTPDGVTTRYTDPATLDVLTLALTGRVKPSLLVALARHGVSAVGLTGLDGGLLRARRRRAGRAVVDGRPVVVRGDHSGRIVGVRTGLLETLLSGGFVPVLSPPALDEDGAVVNTNADRVAAAVAGAMFARYLVFLTGAPGVLDAAGRPVAHYRVRAPGQDAAVTGGMAIKLVAAGEALAVGVPHVVVSAGDRDRPVSAAITGESGTRLS